MSDEQMSDQTNAYPRTPPPSYDTWNEYWTKEYNQPWRTEPEIDEERQRYLATRRTVTPHVARGAYPFRDENGGIGLARADVEWLLATHESGGVYGPVRLEEIGQRTGPDLRGADLRRVNLSDLPLTGALLGLQHEERINSTPEEREMASAYLEWATLDRAILAAASLYHTHGERASLRGALFAGADMASAHLEGANLYGARLEGRYIAEALLPGPPKSRLLPPADLRRVFFDSETNLNNVTLGDARHGFVALADARWNGVNLSVVDWGRVTKLGDEYEAQRSRSSAGKKGRLTRLADYRSAVRANRQLATALRNQGLVEDANRFAYRAQQLQRLALRRQGHIWAAIGSWFLDLISGYGYKPMRSFIAYIVIILVFAGAYLLNAQFAAPHLTWDEALVLSISSFHGRGFFTSGISLSDTLARLAAGEAIIGLLIEITFIATFTQRFFAR